MVGCYSLLCSAQSYDWGKLGADSKVAAFLATSNPAVAVDLDKPYAELWMGTHPNGPCFIVGGDKAEPPALKEWISRDPAKSLGSAVLAKFGGDLPFLFKVLSIRKGLSIQAHPDKALAQKLHKSFPAIYKDPNHKPEMALAITPFEALCGFRPLAEIKRFLSTVPEFAAILEPSIVQAFLSDQADKSSLKTIFGAFCRVPEPRVKEAISSLVVRCKGRVAGKQENDFALNLACRLNEQFPGDIGCFCVFFLNYVKLEPGEAIFLGANEPHAYLSGDCVECMAASDNVVRAGLTPKLRDVDTLISMLTYNFGSAESQILKGDKKGQHSLDYNPPIEEFSVLATRLKAGEHEDLEGFDGPAIAIVTDGQGFLNSDIPVKAGSVYFLEAKTRIQLRSLDSSSLNVFIAYCVV